MTVGWCWLPNLSGRVFSDRYDLIRKLEDQDNSESHSFKVADQPTSDAMVTVIASDRATGRKVVIDVMDQYGLCRLTGHEEGPYDSYFAWSEFRMLLDGCSGTAFSCSAMNLPVRVSEGTSVLDAIARRFLLAVETNSDIVTHAVGTGEFRWRNRRNPVCDPRAECDSNIVYFRSFIEFYRDRLNDTDGRSWEKEMDFRERKVEMAHRYAGCVSNHGFGRATLIISIAALVVSICVGVGSIISAL